MFRVLWGRNTDRTAWMPLPGEHSLLPRILLSCSHSAVRIRGILLPRILLSCSHSAVRIRGILTSAQNTTSCSHSAVQIRGTLTSAQNTTVLLTFGSSDEASILRTRRLASQSGQVQRDSRHQTQSTRGGALPSFGKHFTAQDHPSPHETRRPS